MSLIIEDGSGPAGANSYATVAEARSYASARGVTLSDTDSVVETQLIMASDYLNSFERRYKGKRTAPDTQALSWPRDDVFLFNSCTEFSETAIPQQLKDAQCQLCIDQLPSAGSSLAVTLQPTGSGKEVLRQKTDVIETQYNKLGSSVIQPIFTKTMSILQPLLRFGGAITNVVRA